MEKAREISLFASISIWAVIIGGMVYSHIVYFPPYLSHLPESNELITGEYGFKDQNFWMLIHPFAILFTIIALILNWKLKSRRVLIIAAFSIYTLVLIVSIIYFIPELIAFADAPADSLVTKEEWLRRGNLWEPLSWIRGGFMFIGFLMLLNALTKNRPAYIKG